MSSLFIYLLLLLLFSAFFSASETGIMSLNKYKLRHEAKTSKKAKTVQDLLKRPDRLLGVILIGNNFVNIAASAIATLIGLKLYGELGVLISTVILTFVILIFSEITPKTFASLNPKLIAFNSAFALKILLIILFPFVWLANYLSNNILKILESKFNLTKKSEHLTAEELKTVVKEATALLPSKHKDMLTSILDLETISVNDIMIPRNEIIGININNTDQNIVNQLKNIEHSYIPIYENEIENVIGFINMRDVATTVINDSFSKQKLKSILLEPYFIPERTPLNKQLINFQNKKKKTALVVDEYGGLQGLTTLSDILEEIVGEFTTDINDIFTDTIPQKDGSFIVDASITLRELKKETKITLPHEANTLSGLIIEYLEIIPESNTSILIDNYPIEILQVQDNMIKNVRIYKKIK